MTLQYTNHLKLAVPDFLTEPWHDEFRAAMDAVDQIVYEAIVAANIVLWANNTVYTIGKIVISPDDGLLYVANVAHTSALTPTTFAADRVAHPTFWSSFLPTLASQAEAEAGLENTKYMSALRTKQAILAISPPAVIASQAEAEAGVENTKMMTALRVKQAITALAGPGVGGNIINGYLSWTVAGNILTVAIKNNVTNGDPSTAQPVWVRCRDTTVGTDKEDFIKLTAALSQTISVGSTMGFTNAVPGNLWALLVDPASPQLGIVNAYDGAGDFLSLNGWGITSTIGEGGAGAADSAKVVYTAAVVANKAYAVLGRASWETALATAGNWSAAPDRVQLHSMGMPLPGGRAGYVRSTIATYATGTTVIPLDDTIPQITEGDQFMTRAYSPLWASNVLRIRLEALVSQIGVNVLIFALFQDAIANALTAGGCYAVNSTICMAVLEYMMLAKQTTSTTFRFRLGQNAVTNPHQFNGFNGARLFAGQGNTFFEVEELAG